LHLAAKGGDRELAEMLLDKKVSVHLKDLTKRTPLNEAAYYGNLEVAKILIKRGAGINVPDENGWTPLHWAVYDKQEPMILFLLENQAQINAPSTATATWEDTLYRRGTTPLGIAETRGFEEVAGLLKIHGAK